MITEEAGLGQKSPKHLP